MGNRLIFVFGVLSLIFLVIIVSTHTTYHYKHLILDQKEKAWVLAKTISKSLELPMLEGEMGTVQEMLMTVGKMVNLKRIHITDDKGVIRYSSVPSRIDSRTGSAIIMKALQEKKEIDNFEQRDDDYLFSLALPIHNEKNCYPCHGTKKDILGVLRVGIDWVPIRKSLATVVQRDVIVSLIFYIFILVLSLLFQRLYNNAQRAYSHLQQAQEQLFKTEKMVAVGQMAAAISHDLRNPLTGIKMATYYLGSKLGTDSEEYNNILKDIELEIDYASNVVTNILTYSRPTELIYSRENINKLIEDALHFVHLQNRDNSFEIVTAYDENIPGILMDAKQIKQVIVNLLSNSLQAISKGGRLEIRTLQREKEVEISIKDNGKGIAPEDIDRVFAPFFTTKARGVGLGLSIVKNIVQKHGGTIDVSSVPGEGTTFIVRLPLRTEI